MVLRVPRFIDPFKEPSPVTIFYPEYIYRIGGEIRSEEDLLVKFLARWTQQTDLFIRDQQIVPKPSLWRYMEKRTKITMKLSMKISCEIYASSICARQINT